MAAGGSSRASVAALLANLGIAIAKFVGFLLTRASSIRTLTSELGGSESSA